MKTKADKSQIIMAKRCFPLVLAWLLPVILGGWIAQAQAHELRYRYVSLAQVQAPENIIFYEFHSLNDAGHLYGNAYECGDIDCTFLLPHVAVYRNGTLTISQSYFNGQAVNNKGMLAGEVLIDPQNLIQQAAVYRDDKVALIPPLQPNETFSSAVALNDRGAALIISLDDQSTQVLALYQKGESIPLSIDQAISGLHGFGFRINNQNIISGRGIVDDNQRGLLFNPATGETTILKPLPSEPHSWAMDINNNGNVLGYSFIFDDVERIGIWDKNANFKTYFVEGTPEFPTISNNLLFNDENLIVITNVSNPPTERGFSYVVPKPGTRINLADLVVNLPAGHSRRFVIRDMNNRGDLLGEDRQGLVLLKRFDESH